MLPLHQAYEVRQAVLEYIKATFRFKEAKVGDAFYRFIEDSKNGLFKGPYVSLKTPFVKADENEVIPLDIQPTFLPHLHQVQAFKRLTTHDGHKPEPTLLTTGTGSGKTECFLFPVFDYVYQMNRYEHRQGVKVIILYPMNALASDQAKRLGEAIWNDPRLKGIVTAGLFIGEGTDKKDFPTQMGEHNIIESRDAIVDTVPDILLTNFKMLDYGLMQQRFMPLWKGNIGEK
ncbi:MAG: DEAD/DEAH box helicase, partial [Bacteroidaceae bacterium]